METTESLRELILTALGEAHVTTQLLGALIRRIPLPALLVLQADFAEFAQQAADEVTNSTLPTAFERAAEAAHSAWTDAIALAVTTSTTS
jgi:hypothetical protein